MNIRRVLHVMKTFAMRMFQPTKCDRVAWGKNNIGNGVAEI